MNNKIIRTPHLVAGVNDFAKKIIVVGDPLRSQYIATQFLTNPKLVNNTRGIQGYTGEYNGKRVSVIAHGMGMGSAGIYFYELYNFFNVETIIRVGSCGSYDKNVKLLDIILASSAYTESNYVNLFDDKNVNYVDGSKDLIEKIGKQGGINNLDLKIGTIYTADFFDAYTDWEKVYKRVKKEVNALAIEMECFILYYFAKKFKRKAACLLTVTDSNFSKKTVLAEDRQNKFDKAIKLALDSI